MQRIDKIFCQNHIKTIMKKAFFLLLILPILFSCKKENDISNLRIKIIGTWELEKNICGECITQVSTFPQGNGNIIVLSANGTFERRKHDTLLFKGYYSLKKNKECNKRSGDIAFSTNESSTPTPFYITIDTDKLELSTPYCYADGAINIYTRLK